MTDRKKPLELPIHTSQIEVIIMAKNQKPQEKSWWKSKTIWVNFVALLIVWLSDLHNMLTTGQSVTLMAVVNLILRGVTKTKLGK